MIRLAAIEGARRDGLRAEGEEVPWGEIENRPYLSACAHLALTRLHQGRHAEAARLFEELLRQEPDDHQGVRLLYGEALHLAGDLDRARDVYEGLFGDSCADFNLALVEIERGNPELAPRPLLRGFGGNPYVAPMLLGDPWQRLPFPHATNLAEPGWAADYAERMGSHWLSIDGALDLLSDTWTADPIVHWRERLDQILVELAGLEPGPRGVRIGLKRAWSDFTTALYLTAEELVERLVALENPEGLLLVPTRSVPTRSSTAGPRGAASVASRRAAKATQAGGATPGCGASANEDAK